MLHSKWFLPLIFSVSLYAQVTSIPSAAGGTVTAGDGITVIGSQVNVDTAVIASRAGIQAGTNLYCRSTTGNDTYTCTLNPTLTAYTRGSCLVLDPDTANTGAATINVDAQGAKSILNRGGAALLDGDITVNKPLTICYDGTQFIIQGLAKAGRVLISTQTASASASLDFANVFSASFTQYEIVYIDVVPDTNSVTFRARASTDGSTFLTTSIYSVASLRANTTSTFVGGATAGSPATTMEIVGSSISNVANNGGVTGRSFILNPQSAIYKKITSQFNVGSIGPDVVTGTSAGLVQTTSALTGFQFYFSTGNIASGEIRVYGLLE